MRPAPTNDPTPAELGKHIESEIAKWREVRDKAGIQQQ